MTRADRIERMLAKMEEARRKNLGKLRGSGAPAIRASAEASMKDASTIFLCALAAVSDADLWHLEVEMGLPRGDSDRGRALGTPGGAPAGDTGAGREGNPPGSPEIPPGRKRPRATRRPPKS